MIYTVQKIIRKIRIETKQDVEIEDVIANQDMGMYIDDAQDDIAEVILKERPEMLSHYFDLSVDGSSEYYIPDQIPFDYETILLVEDVTNSDSSYRTSVTNWFDRMNYFQNDILPTYEPWSIRDQYIEFPDKPSSSTFRIWYTRRPVGLFYGTSTAGTNTTVTFPASPTVGEIRIEDDYYNGMKIYCDGGGEIRRITDYVGSTKVATVNSAWSSNPTSSTTISLLSSLPERFHKLIPSYAVRAIKCAFDDDDTQIIRLIDDEMEARKSRIVSTNKMSPEFIRQVPRLT